VAGGSATDVGTALSRSGFNPSMAVATAGAWRCWAAPSWRIALARSISPWASLRKMRSISARIGWSVPLPGLPALKALC